MWQRLTNPLFLVYLQVSYPLTVTRRQLNWMEQDYLEQVHRLRHAYTHANLVIDTDPLNPHEVLDRILAFLKENGVQISPP
jgi:regulator of sirC expression with transglutaminase-like and TPR domain